MTESELLKEAQARLAALHKTTEDHWNELVAQFLETQLAPIKADIAELLKLLKRLESGEEVILNIKQAADLLQIQPRTVRRLAKTGRLPYKKIGREMRFSQRKLLSL